MLLARCVCLLCVVRCCCLVLGYCLLSCPLLVVSCSFAFVGVCY